MIKKEITCHICNKRTVIGDLRANRDGKSWICVSCYENQFPRKQLKKERNYNKLTLPKSKLSKYPDTKYKCASCFFITEKLSINAFCPNCGRKNTLYKLPSASEILKEVNMISL
ncbi:MAG: hypothetical protein AABW46_03745 [Nanoarchaeota archaeon]